MTAKRFILAGAVLTSWAAGFIFGVVRWNGDAMRSVYEYGYSDGFRAGHFRGRCEVASPTVVRGFDSEKELTQ